MIARFKGGPLDGQEAELAEPWLTIEVPQSITVDALANVGLVPTHRLRIPGAGAITRYTLGQTDDRKGIVYYHVVV